MKCAILLALLVCGAFAGYWPKTWIVEDKTSGDARVSFTLALKHHNMDEFNALFESITTPGFPEYGNYRTMQELTDMIAPPKVQQARVVNFLHKFGCSAESFGDFVVAEGPVSAVEKVFGVQIHNFRHLVHDVVIQRSIDFPTIPSRLSDVVTFVTGIATFPHERAPVKKTPIEMAVASDNDKWVVPQTIRAMYNIPEGTEGTQKTNSMAVAEFGIVAGISQTDLDTFNQLTDGPDNATLAYTVGTFAFTPISPIDGECTLDVQYIMGVAPNVATSFWTINGWIYDFTTLIQQRQNTGRPVPLIFSISYGWAEADQCEVTGNGESCAQLGGNSGYLDSVNTNFQKIGASGITLLVASGDAGAATKENIDCRDQTTPIQPDFPASSPYITTVGGTMLKDGGNALTGNLPPFCQKADVTCAGGGDEIVCSVPQALITSGGGFSNEFSQPSYQSAAVNSWMNSGAEEPASLSQWNPSGRGYPDVAGLAHKYLIVENGRQFSVDGTSASTPVTAGILALINDARLANGQSAIGFVNPALYQMSQSNFNDVTEGDNTGTEFSGDSYCFTDTGYGAGAGWDPTTGFGTPNFVAWRTYFETNN